MHEAQRARYKKNYQVRRSSGVLFFILTFWFSTALCANDLRLALIGQNIDRSNRLYYAYYWLLPQSSYRNVTVDDLEAIVQLLITKHHFPNTDVLNNFVLETDQFLNIRDKYLLINYITNFTPFAQTYVDKYKISTERFNDIIDDAKAHNKLPQNFVDHIKTEYTTYALLNKAINSTPQTKIIKQISQIKDRNMQSLLYTRLYFKGDSKYRMHYQYTKEHSIDNELSIHDKVAHYAKNENYRSIASHIANLPPTLQYGDIWWENNQVTILQMIENGFAESAYSLLQKMYLSRSHKNFARKEMLAGTLALFLKKPDEAYQHFYNVYSNTNYLDEQIQASYFMAQSYNKLKNSEAHKYWLTMAARYPTTFYGLMAFEELEGLPGDTILGSNKYMDRNWVNNIKERRTAIKKRFQTFVSANFYKNTKKYDDLPQYITEMLEIAKILYDANYTNYAKDFVLSATKQIKDLSLLPPLLSYTCETYNKYICYDAKVAAIHSGYINEEFFPKIENAAIYNDIKQYHLPLLHAIIKKESNFKTDIKSRVGARGLMQIMPSTAKFVCHMHNIQYNQRQLNYSEDYNIKLGTLYINDLLKRYNGSYILTLMAYNAGYGSLSKWIDTYSYPQTLADMVIFTELIPFKETRNYVKRTIAYEAIYQYIDFN